MRRRRNRRATASLKRLYKVFERSEASLVHSLPIRKTISGIWVPRHFVSSRRPSQFSRISVFSVRRHHNALWSTREPATGGSRLFLRRVDPTRPVYGIEKDPALFAQALVNLQGIRARGVIDHTCMYLVEADYCEMATYETAGIDLSQTGVILNYPDGNQKRLARFIAEHGGRERVSAS